MSKVIKFKRPTERATLTIQGMVDLMLKDVADNPDVFKKAIVLMPREDETSWGQFYMAGDMSNSDALMHVELWKADFLRGEYMDLDTDKED